ncbi:hypothetical protein PF008_g4371 [Phytophthora fragariae]|uniref:Uncharacterized protein n=1 Tax=Phytophthora fragariae TaxID=53985 RepID=A0A6G0SBR2_9STRA|nr:hypothetical protein PF008_g4371 [Phytophthora fragariae]
MTNAASRQKANNAKNVTPANVQVKPASATAVNIAKFSEIVAETSTRAVQSTGSNIIANLTTNANATNNIKVTVVKTATAKNSKPFMLSDVTTWSVQRARQIRKTDFERFAKLHKYFTAKDDAVARPINSKASSKREHVDQWVRSVLNPKTLACIQDTQETQQALLSLIIVSAALTKYGEQELVRRNSFGEMDSVIAARFGTNGMQSKQQMHSVGASFVLRLVLGLAPEKRAACQTLREILNLENNQRLVLAPTAKGLMSISDKTNAADWTKVNQLKLKHMVKLAQSDKFQDAMQQLGGQHMYDAIRTQLKQVGGAWDASKDKPALQVKNIRHTEKSVKLQKETERHKEQLSKNAACDSVKDQNEAVGKNPPLEAAKWTQIPPPTPAVQTTSTVSNNKSVISVKNITQGRDTTPVKSVPLMGAWSGPLPASVVLSRSSAIVSSVPTMSARGGNGSRAILSRAM